MIIAAAWVRTLKKSEELIVVSDSRLYGGGMRMGCGQKNLGKNPRDCLKYYSCDG